MASEKVASQLRTDLEESNDEVKQLHGDRQEGRKKSHKTLTNKTYQARHDFQ